MKELKPSDILSCVLAQGDKDILDLMDRVWGDSVYEKLLEDLEDLPDDELKGIYDEFCKNYIIDFIIHHVPLDEVRNYFGGDIEPFSDDDLKKWFAKWLGENDDVTDEWYEKAVKHANGEK